MGTPITIILTVTFFVVVLVSLERWARGLPKRRYRAAAKNGAVCGACAHPVSLPHSTRCPECGDTYAHAGIFTRALEVRVGPPLITSALVSVFACLFLGLMMAGLAFGLAASYFPNTVQGQMTQIHGYTPSATWNASNAPAPNYIFEVKHEGPTTGVSSPAMPTSGTVTINILGAPDTGASAVYDIALGTWTMTDQSGAVLDSGNDFADGAEALMRHSGLDNAWDGSQRELEDARLIASEATLSTTPPPGLPGSNTFGLNNNSSSSSFAGGSSTTSAPLVLLASLIIGAFPVLGSIAIFIVKGVRQRRILNPTAT